jgi:hypothetical protein
VGGPRGDGELHRTRMDACNERREATASALQIARLGHLGEIFFLGWLVAHSSEIALQLDFFWGYLG